MRRISTVVTATLLSATLFSSCTCRQQVETAPPLPERKSGFQTSEGKKPAPTATATAARPVQEMAQAKATPTVAPVQMPPDFPADVPVFKDASLSQVQDLANDAHNVIFRSSAPVEDVATFYQESMTKGGWKITQQINRSNHAFYTFQKGDMLANVTIAEDIKNPGSQVIAIMYEQQKPMDQDEF